MTTAYIRPRDIDEAVSFLQGHQGVSILAGGTDVMIDRRSGKLDPRFLLDVSRLDELRKITASKSVLEVGAAVTLSEILESETIARLAPSLGKCAAHFGSRQIRNVATIGGNVAHCSPCGDTIPPLLIHDAEAVVVGPGGTRTLAIEEMASGPYRCALRPDEIITHFRLRPRPDGVRFADFQKIGRRRELAISRLSMAAMAGLDDSRTISYIRFAIGSCTPTPHRFREVEAFLTGKRPDESLLWQAGGLAADTMIGITGKRPSATYKKPAVQGLFLRLMAPLVQIRGKNDA